MPRRLFGPELSDVTLLRPRAIINAISEKLQKIEIKDSADCASILTCRERDAKSQSWDWTITWNCVCGARPQSRTLASVQGDPDVGRANLQNRPNSVQKTQMMKHILSMILNIGEFILTPTPTLLTEGSAASMCPAGRSSPY